MNEITAFAASTLDMMVTTFNRESAEALTMIRVAGSLEDLHGKTCRAMGIATCFADMIDSLNRAAGYSIPEKNLDEARAARWNALERIEAAQRAWISDNAPWSK